MLFLLVLLDFWIILCMDRCNAQNQSILMMAQGRNIDRNTIFIAIEGRALGEAMEDV